MLQLREAGEDRLTVIHDDTGWTRGLLIGALGIAVWGIVLLGQRPRDAKKLTGCLAGTIVLGFMALIAHEKGVFEFDRRRRVISWHRRRAFSRRQGELPFDEVKSIVVQTSPSSKTTPTRRVALLLNDGELPISNSYAPDADQHCQEVAVRMWQFLGRADDS